MRDRRLGAFRQAFPGAPGHRLASFIRCVLVRSPGRVDKGCMVASVGPCHRRARALGILRRSEKLRPLHLRSSKSPTMQNPR
jgi:hypothetical protein